MQVRWTTAAARTWKTLRITSFEKTPGKRPALDTRDLRSGFRAEDLPNRGRPGKKSGTRELVLPALPYIVVYKVGSDVLRIARILHGAQQWPR